MHTGGMSWSVHAIPLPDGDAPVDRWVDGTGRLVTDPIDDAEPLPGSYVLPGLVDAHAHPAIGGGSAGPVALDGMSALAALAEWAHSGVSLVRDVGSPGGSTLNLALAPGLPRVQAAGRFLAPAGRYFPQLLPEAAPEGRVTELALAELARGARWVKVIADFPFLDATQLPGPPAATYATATIAELVVAVHAVGGRVAAHCTTDLVADLVSAGVDSIEHGTAIDEPTLHLMAATGAAWTPTLGAVLAGASGSPDQARRAAEYRSRLRELLPLANSLGVPILTGTDTVGTIAGEVALLAELNLEPIAALAAATTTAYRFLGEQFDEPGRLTSLVTYGRDPREDAAVLSTPLAVLLDGIRVR